MPRKSNSHVAPKLYVLASGRYIVWPNGLVCLQKEGGSFEPSPVDTPAGRVFRLTEIPPTDAVQDRQGRLQWFGEDGRLRVFNGRALAIINTVTLEPLEYYEDALRASEAALLAAEGAKAQQEAEAAQRAAEIARRAAEEAEQKARAAQADRAELEAVARELRAGGLTEAQAWAKAADTIHKRREAHVHDQQKEQAKRRASVPSAVLAK